MLLIKSKGRIFQILIRKYGLGASFLQLGDQLLGIFLGDSFLQGLGAVVHQILGILQAQAGSGTVCYMLLVQFVF